VTCSGEFSELYVTFGDRQRGGGGEAMGRANLANRNANRAERDNLEATPGFTASGTSQWERQAAAGGKVETSSIVDTRTMSRLEFLIHRNVKELINFEERANQERDPDKVTKLLKNIGIKRRFINKLREEQRR
jgi:hypothetical protein